MQLQNCQCDCRLDARQTKKRACLAAVGVATLAASALYAPFVQHGPVVCPFRLLTGLPCPGCGLTRSFCAMSHGHLTAAFSEHWMGPALFGFVLISIPLLLSEAITRRRSRFLNLLVFSRPVGMALGVGMALFQIQRLIMIYSAGQIGTDIQSSLIWNLGHGLMKLI